MTKRSKRQKGIKGPPPLRGCFMPLALAAFLAPASAGILLTALWFFTYYTPFVLCGMILLLWPVCALPLFLRASLSGNPPADQDSEPENEEKTEPRTAESKRGPAAAAIISSLLLAAFLAGFLILLVRKTSLGRVGWPTAVTLLIVFAALIAADRLLKNISGLGSLGMAFISSSRSYIAAGRLSVVVAAAAEIIKLLAGYDIQKPAVILLSAVFFYCYIFFALSLAARAIRKELDVRPDLTVPVPFAGNTDIGILGYLEKNTGISMRSLFSIKLIKTVIPFALTATLLLLWICTGLVEIAPNEKGAVYRFGKLKEDFLEPGLHLTLPYPIDRVEKFETETVKSLTVGYISNTPSDVIWTMAHGGEEYKLLLGDGNQLVSVNLRIEYRISDLASYIRYGPSPDSVLLGTAYELITSMLVTSDLETLLAIDRSDFSDRFSKLLSDRLKPGGDLPDTGLSVLSVVLESIHPPVEVAEKYQELISAGINADRYLLEAKGYAARVKAEAETERDTAIASATAEKYNKIAVAEAAVSEFMAGVEADTAYSGTYRVIKYQKALTQAYSSTALVIVGDGIDSSRIWIGGSGSVLPN